MAYCDNGGRLWITYYRIFHLSYKRSVVCSFIYLADIDKQAEAMFSRLLEQMAEHEGITEELKAEHPMEGIGRMNALRESAVEIVNAEVIFA